jgi:hypothetical protein
MKREGRRRYRTEPTRISHNPQGELRSFFYLTDIPKNARKTSKSMHSVEHIYVCYILRLKSNMCHKIKLKNYIIQSINVLLAGYIQY